jgi:SAM-dependent methyltransferase
MEDHKNLTKEFYNRNAHRYVEKHTALFAQQKKEVEQFLKLLNGKRILDLGCGPGEHALHFKQLGYDVKAIDYSEKMVEIARKKDVDVELMDIEEMSFPEESFDGIWSDTSLLHIKKSDLPAVVKKLHDILAKDGILYISIFEGRGERYIVDGGLEEKRYFAFWEKSEITNLFLKYFTLEHFFGVSVKEKHFLEFFFKKK